MCKWFGYNPKITFVTYSQIELSQFSGVVIIKVIRYLLVPGVCNSSYSYMPILLKLYIFFDHGQKNASGLI